MNLAKFLTVFILSLTSLSAQFIENGVKDSIVKIYTVASVPNYLEPWNVSTSRSSGSGSIIEGHMILTNAHVVANHTFIEVRRYGKRKRYRAKVLSVSHQADLALLQVEDESFFKGAKPLHFGSLPQIQQKITVYGFPTGGDTLSVTTGIVSRIEHTRYVHSGERFLAIQVDAAINPGNSGGPALSDGKIVGVVMQQRRQSQNIGYLVPVVIIKHFIEDMKDGKYDGFPDIGVVTQRLESPALKKMYHLDENQTGQLIINKLYNCGASDAFEVGDVLVSIDGHKIEDDGTVEFRHHEYTSYKYYQDLHQLGDEVVLDILRGKEKRRVHLKLTHKGDDFLLVKTMRYDSMPRYFIFGGYVFSPLTNNLLSSTRSQLLPLRAIAQKWPSKEKQDVVLVVKVLAADFNRGDHGLQMWMVEKINAKPFKTFDEFYQKMRDAKEKFIRLEDADGAMIAIDRQKALDAQEMILKRYHIQKDKSIDLIP
jgi:S1-C subfamily serine protease